MAVIVEIALIGLLNSILDKLEKFMGDMDFLLTKFILMFLIVTELKRIQRLEEMEEILTHGMSLKVNISIKLSWKEETI